MRLGPKAGRCRPKIEPLPGRAGSSRTDGAAYKAEVLYTDPQKDIAILKITDNQFKGLGPIPYSFKKGESDLG